MIYLDNNSTTRPSPGVVEAVGRGLTDFWHNPSSMHRPGQAARQQVELARREAAALIGVPAKEVTFTSGGTEAIDLAIRGFLASSSRRVVVSTRIEHAAVRDLLEDLSKRDRVEVRWAPVSNEGVVELEALREVLHGAGLVSIQWANNETGAVQPVAEVAALCREAGALFHCDATQWVGKEPVIAPPSDLMTFSPHKFHGPKGVGIFWARRGVGIRPVIHGTQELGRRGGTENVPGIIGAGVACGEAQAWLARAEEREQLRALRDDFESRVRAEIPHARVNSGGAPRLWNTTNIGFPRLEAEALLLYLSERGLCASAGAACSSGSLEPSPVLLAMGVPAEFAHGSLRFSLSRETTPEEVATGARLVAQAVRALSESMPT